MEDRFYFVNLTYGWNDFCQTVFVYLYKTGAIACRAVVQSKNSRELPGDPKKSTPVWQVIKQWPFVLLFKYFLNSEFLFINIDFDTLTTQIQRKSLEIHQLKDRVSFSWYAEFEKFRVINFAKRQIVVNGHLWALGHSVLILSHSYVGEGRGDHKHQFHWRKNRGGGMPSLFSGKWLL